MYSVIGKMLQVFIGSLLAGIHLFWHIPFLIFACLGFPKWVISDIKQIDIALKKIDDGNVLSSQLRWHHGRIKNDGLILSWKLGIIGFLYDKTEGSHVVSEMAVIARKKYFDILISSTEAEAFSVLKHPKNTMDSLVAEGYHWNPFYNDIEIKFHELEDNISQTQIVEDIYNYFKRFDHCTAFISGLPGTGKSTIAALLTMKLNGVLCETFDPTRPGFTLSKLIIRANPTKERPLIILFDEVDVIIEDVNSGIVPHKHIPIWIRNKTTFNKFLDHMRFHENVILIMTSNFTKEQIGEKYDPCYLRPGRVHVYATL